MNKYRVPLRSVVVAVVGAALVISPTFAVHMGEGLPFMFQRVDIMVPAMAELQRPISAYLRDNVLDTFSGFNFTPTFPALLLEVGVDRVMFSADYPYQSTARARAFLDNISVNAAAKERIAYGNAERLFKLPA